MFSDRPRCIYANPQLADVVCQLRFPTILTINAEEPAAFQEGIRAQFPRYSVSNAPRPVRVTNLPGQPPRVEQEPAVKIYRFTTEDGASRIELSRDTISLACRQYDRWETFARMMDKPLATFIQTYAPAGFTRVGLRYLNAFSRQELGLEGVPFSDLLEPAYLGLLARTELQETRFSRCSQDVDLRLPENCDLKLHAGPGVLKQGGKSDGEVKLILDIDVSIRGNTPNSMAAAAMETVHRQAGHVFRDAITDILHEALDPV